MTADLVVRGQASIGDGPHQVNAAAGAVVFVAEFEIGGAGGGAQAAVDAVEEEFVVDFHILPNRPKS